MAITLPLASLHAQEDGFVSLFDGKSTDGWKNPYKWGESVIMDCEIHLKGDKKWFSSPKKLITTAHDACKSEPTMA